MLFAVDAAVEAAVALLFAVDAAVEAAVALLFAVDAAVDAAVALVSAAAAFCLASDTSVLIVSISATAFAALVNASFVVVFKP